MSVDLTSLQPLKLLPRVDMDPEEFRKLVFTHGMRWTWEQSAPCPCVRVLEVEGSIGETGEPRVECDRCHGTGLIYHSPLEIRALGLSARADPGRFAIYGEYAKGMISISLLPEHLPSHLDRFIALDLIVVYRDHVVRKGTTEELIAPIVRRDIQTLGDPVDPTIQRPETVGVLYCSKADSDGIAYGDPLVEGVDFVVTDEGKLSWSLGDANGTAPDVGEKYALAWYGHPSYLVLNHPHLVRATFTGTQTGQEYRDLPVQADCGLEFNQLRGV